MSIKILVLAIGENGLGVSRSLGTARVPFGVIAYSRDDVCLKSKYPSVKFFIDISSEEEREGAILDILSGFEYRDIILIPTSDWYVDFLDKYRDELGKKFKLSVPPAGLAEKLIDKRMEIELIRETAPIPVSLSTLPDNKQDMLDNLRLPIIVKPRSFSMNALNQKNVILRDEDEVTEFYRKYGDHLSTMIAQEVVPGGDDCLWLCYCFFDGNNELCTALVFQRLRTSPPHFGVTSYARSEYNETVIGHVKSIGRKLRYVGPLMFEFKYDCRDGEYKYIEINPRLGMCNFYSTYCGQNNVYSIYCLHSGIQVPRLYGKQKNDVIFFNFFDDVYSRRKDGESVIAIAKDYLSDLFRPHVFAYFYWRDPLPYFYISKRQKSRMLKSLAKRIRLHHLTKR